MRTAVTTPSTSSRRPKPPPIRWSLIVTFAGSMPVPWRRRLVRIQVSACRPRPRRRRHGRARCSSSFPSAHGRGKAARRLPRTASPSFSLAGASPCFLAMTPAPSDAFSMSAHNCAWWRPAWAPGAHSIARGPVPASPPMCCRRPPQQGRRAPRPVARQGRRVLATGRPSRPCRRSQARPSAWRTSGPAASHRCRRQFCRWPYPACRCGAPASRSGGTARGLSA